MLKKLFAAIVTFVFAVSAMAAGNVVLVDHAHMQLGDNATSKLSYSVSPSSEIVLDLGNYKFTLWPKSEPAPDSVSVVIADNQQYYLQLQPGKKKYSLSRSTLTPRAGSIPFSSFASGQQIMIAIGRLRIDHIKKEEAFRVHWLGLVDVK
ncbi:hypothetical protein SAMN05660284_02683 [Formivibrio citricus]|uniref:Uncharacterized protein n=2 Tax=Formivibrio citricus TaxID=83765 RepID=A0A1I5DJJ2_9NEIS|nr:hypothetical protein SAMN05660284_02683 [Formivibrio citricus]